LVAGFSSVLIAPGGWRPTPDQERRSGACLRTRREWISVSRWERSV